jgi:hypothetical protein
VALETFSWVQREMTDAAGGWYASLDADSEGHEGLFYVWTEQAFRDHLGADADIAARHWGVTPGGNFETANILHVAVPFAELAAETGRSETELRALISHARDRLFAAREPRVRPARDEKVLGSWNGLMLRAMAEGARAFSDSGLADVAIAAGVFLRRALVRDGRALRSWRDGSARIPGFLEDHAALGLGFLALYQLTFDREWLDAAIAMDAQCALRFWDDDIGAFFDTAHDAEPLVTRPRDVTDNAIPSGTSLAVELQLALSVVTGDSARRRRADYVIATLAGPVRQNPMAFGHLLGAADLAIHGPVELAIAGDPGTGAFRLLAANAAAVYVPSLIVLGGAGEAVVGLPLMEGRSADPDGARAFVCRGYACDLPTSDPAILTAQLLNARSMTAK